MTLSTWGEAFVFTQACEVPVWLVAFRRTGVALGDAALYAFTASAVTHPVVWFVFPLLPLPYWPMVALAEAFAIGVEAALAARLGVKRALLWSTLANALSAGLGLGLRALGDS